MLDFTKRMNQLAGGLARVSGGYEMGLFGMEGRGAYAGSTIAGLHAEVSHRDGASWEFEERVYYKLRNDGPDPKTKKPRKYVGLSVPTLGAFADVLVYDHGNRNDNPIQKELMGKDGWKDKKGFEKLAKDNDLATGKYPRIASLFHGAGVNDKMWMGRKSIFSFLYGWLLIPSVEGVFNKETGKPDYNNGPSYNYGNNILSHIFLDVIPWVIMD